ncbi:26654_t:CDS:2, partial [Gigaspora margarita]
MLQLSVREGLKQIKFVYQRLKSIQAFFHLPKQAQQLREAQIYVSSANLSQETDENEMIRPLEILTNSASLQINSNSISKKE